MTFKMRIVHEMPFDVTTLAVGQTKAAVYTIEITEDSFLPSSRWALSARSVLNPKQIYWLGPFAEQEKEADEQVRRSWEADASGDQRIAAIISAIVTSGGGKIL